MRRNSLESSIFEYGGDDATISLFTTLKRLYLSLIREKKAKHDRFLSTGDYIMDRWERARLFNFGEGSSVYDSCLVLGAVQVGMNTWIGAYTVLDGSGGGLRIGNDCALSAGVHVYTHDTVDRVINGGGIAIAPVSIGNHVYIGPHTVIQKGVTIGDYVVIGANSLVNKDIPSGCKAYGSPARIIGLTSKK